MSVYCIGETVLDIIFKNNQLVSAKAGGSVLNSSVSLGRLGVDVKFISDYGQDKVGMLIDEFLRENHVDTDAVVRFSNNKSALALAFLDESNDASYTFYKDFPEKRLGGVSVKFSKQDYLLFGSFFAITEAIRGSLEKLLVDAKKSDAIIIYDPNFRKPHLNELEKVKPWIIGNMQYADIVKGSDEDFKLIFNADNPQEAYEHVLGSGCKNLVYTSGAKDVIAMAPGIRIQIKVPEIEPVSTIGAGDNFNAGIVYTLIREDIHKNELEKIGTAGWEKIIRNGIAFASHVCLSYENYISRVFAKELKKNSI